MSFLAVKCTTMELPPALVERLVTGFTYVDDFLCLQVYCAGRLYEVSKDIYAGLFNAVYLRPVRPSRPI